MRRRKTGESLRFRIAERQHRKRGQRKRKEDPVRPEVDHWAAARDGVREEHTTEQDDGPYSEHSSRPTLATGNGPENQRKCKRGSRGVLAGFPDNVKVLVRRGAGLEQVELRSERRAEDPENVNRREHAERDPLPHRP